MKVKSSRASTKLDLGSDHRAVETIFEMTKRRPSDRLLANNGTNGTSHSEAGLLTMVDMLSGES